jgi:hypothetical protein
MPRMLDQLFEMDIFEPLVEEEHTYCVSCLMSMPKGAPDLCYGCEKEIDTFLAKVKRGPKQRFKRLLWKLRTGAGVEEVARHL